MRRNTEARTTVATRAWRGLVVEESLEDAAALAGADVLSTRTTQDGDWRIHTVSASPDTFSFEALARSVKQGWYAHFWKDGEVLAVFRDALFRFDHDRRETWEPALEHGRSLGIPDAELDFPIDEL